MACLGLDHIAGHEDRIVDLVMVIVLLQVLVVGAIYGLYLFAASQFHDGVTAVFGVVCVLLICLTLALL